MDVEAAAARPIEEIDALLARNLTDDRVFGVLSHHRLGELYDQEKLAAIAALIRDVPVRPWSSVGVRPSCSSTTRPMR